MAPARIAKRFRRLYSRAECSLRRYSEVEDLANARLEKAMTIWSRWPLLEDETLYSEDLLAIVGLKSKVLAKQAGVLGSTCKDIEQALKDLEDAVGSLRQVSNEAKAFLRNEYKNNKNAAAFEEEEERTLTIGASEYVQGLDCIYKMYEKCLKLKVAAYEEIKSCKDTSERDALSTYFFAPPCLDQNRVRILLAKAQT